MTRLPKITAIRNELEERIEDASLRSSLSLVREAAEEIWSTNAPRIVKGFTDHSTAHSERVLRLAEQLAEPLNP